MDAYIAQASEHSEVERMLETREKTGVFTGAFAVNPTNGAEIPVWIRDGWEVQEKTVVSDARAAGAVRSAGPRLGQRRPAALRRRRARTGAQPRRQAG
mgnify:CR=1 FL=1